MQAVTETRTTDNRIVYSILILAFYLLGQFGSDFLYSSYSHLLTGLSRSTRSVIWSATYFGIVPLLGFLLIFGRKGSLERMGLHQGFWSGLSSAWIMSLPMLVGYAWLANFSVNIDWGRDFLYGSIAAPFFEEFFFRAFLFGLLYRYAGWGVWPATLLDGALFGAIHISQGESIENAAAVFAVTGLGAAGFSILYKEWNWNLWLVIFLHAFMNFYWMAFDVADNAAGGAWANVFRGMTVAIAIFWTLKRSKSMLKQSSQSTL